MDITKLKFTESELESLSSIGNGNPWRGVKVIVKRHLVETDNMKESTAYESAHKFISDSLCKSPGFNTKAINIYREYVNSCGNISLGRNLFYQVLSNMGVKIKICGGNQHYAIDTSIDDL